MLNGGLGCDGDRVVGKEENGVVVRQGAGDWLQFKAVGGEGRDGGVRGGGPWCLTVGIERLRKGKRKNGGSG